MLLAAARQIELLRQNGHASDFVYEDVAGTVSGQNEIGFLARAIMTACAADRFHRVGAVDITIKIKPRMGQKSRRGIERIESAGIAEGIHLINQRVAIAV